MRDTQSPAIELDSLVAMPPDLFGGHSVDVAPALIGSILLFNGTGGRIVETEAYDQSDLASHSFKGMRPSNQSMFGPPAHVYVYRSYGVHWCLNFVCEATGHGAAVLIRALEPLFGVAEMKARRGQDNIRLLCAGPGRLTQALGIDNRHDGLSLTQTPFALFEPPEAVDVVIGPRIGISKAVDEPWRFGLARSRFVSRRFP